MNFLAGILTTLGKWALKKVTSWAWFVFGRWQKNRKREAKDTKEREDARKKSDEAQSRKEREDAARRIRDNL